MLQKGARVNTPKGFARVVAHHFINTKLAYSVELEKDSSRHIYSSLDVSLSPATAALIQEYLSDIAKLKGISDEEVTKNTCPSCHGAGYFENRSETKTSYAITRETCFLCDGASVVSAEVYARYARMVSKLV